MIASQEMENQKELSLEDINKMLYPDRLYPRHWQVLKMRLLGYTYVQISKELYIGLATTSARISEIYDIVGLNGPQRPKQKQKELMHWATEHGLIEIKFEVPNGQ